MASHCAPGTLWGGDGDGHPPGDGSQWDMDMVVSGIGGKGEIMGSCRMG